MVYKCFKSWVAADLLQKETSVCIANPAIKKIDFKILAKNLFDKDKCANLELNLSLFSDSSYYSN